MHTWIQTKLTVNNSFWQVHAQIQGKKKNRILKYEKSEQKKKNFTNHFLSRHFQETNSFLWRCVGEEYLGEIIFPKLCISAKYNPSSAYSYFSLTWVNVKGEESKFHDTTTQSWEVKIRSQWSPGNMTVKVNQ